MKNISIGETNQEIYNNIINNKYEYFENLNDEGRIIKGIDDCYFYITKLENTSNSYYNLSIQFNKIDLNECENLLRRNYSISDDVSLAILSFQKLTNISSEKEAQFEIYELLNMTKLDISICKDIPIYIYVPIILSEKMQNLYKEMLNAGYNLFDINDKFYQDICTPFTSDHNTDIILSDRINYYYYNDEIQCQSGCKSIDYFFESKTLKCECVNIQSKISNLKVKYENAKSIYKSFYEVLKYSNYRVVKCYKLAFKLNNFTENVGTIICLVFFCIYLIFFIIHFTTISKTFNDYKLKTIIIEEKNDIINEPIIINRDSSKNFSFRKVKKKKKKKKIIIKHIMNKNEQNIENNSININYPKIQRRKSSNTFSMKSNSELIYEKGKFDNNFDSKIEINKNINDDYELNNMDYNEALNMDKRKIYQMYWSLLKREHLIIFTIFIKNDHNFKTMKFARLFFLICTDMTLNVFFFSDENMHKIFLDYGKYNFFQQLTQIIYSSIVTQLIDSLLCYLCLTDNDYYKIKGLTNKSQENIKILMRYIKIKIIFFFAFTFSLFLFYIYVITCFCAVYNNSQIIFIKDYVSSFILDLLCPFILYIFPTILRYISLKHCSKKVSIIYKLSKIIPLF